MMEVCKQYLPYMSVGFSNPLVQVHTQDGAEFLLNNRERFDVIITDSSDPIGEFTVYVLYVVCDRGTVFGAQKSKS